MKRKNKKIIMILLLGVSSTLFAQSAWKAPDTANGLQNPTKDYSSSLKNGKKLYKQQCLMCHGAKGNGRGPAGIALTPKPANFTSEKLQQQSDGELFWKLTNGKSPMAAYEKILSVQQRWDLINYIRTFKK